MKIQFMGQYEAEKITPASNMAVISITALNAAGTRNLQPGWGARIDLNFSDIDHELPNEPKYEGYIVFNSAIAQSLKTWINSLPDSVDHIVIHCFQGISRSSAVARVLCEKYNQKFPEEAYGLFYNKLVYSVLKSAMNE